MFQFEKKNLKVNKKSEPKIILKEHQLLFSQLLTVGAVCQYDLKEVLSHELSAIPLSLSLFLFHTTGEIRKTNKSQLELEETSMSYQ